MTQMKKRLFLTLVLFAVLSVAFAEPAFANPALIMRGVAKTLFSVLQIPRHMLSDSVQMGPLFPVGILTGTVKGTIYAVAGTLDGAVDIARGAAPYAKYMLFLI